MNVTESRAGMAQTVDAATGAWATNAKANPGLQKLENAAREFEGVLMASVWQAWNKSNQFGNPQDEIGSSITGMSLEMAAIAMAEKGGFGLARMIVKSLKGTITEQNRK